MVNKALIHRETFGDLGLEVAVVFREISAILCFQTSAKIPPTSAKYRGCVVPYIYMNIKKD
jgi:hypothetical protein